MTEATARDDSFFAPTARGVEPISRRRSITNRQATAQRFLFEAADEVYDGELDIDWDAPPDPDRTWLPAEAVSLAGSRILRKVTPRQREELSKHELVNLLTLVSYADNALAMLTFREVGEGGELVDDRSRWLLKCVNTHTRNITMFGRLIDTTGIRPYTRERLKRRLEHWTLFVPSGALTSSVILLLESASQNLIRLAASDESVQPHVTQIMNLHLISTRRHLDYAKEEFTTEVPVRGVLGRFICSVFTAVVVFLIGRLLVNPDVYTNVGLPAGRARRAALRSKSYRLRMDAAFNSALSFSAQYGLFRDPVSRTILRFGQAPVPKISRARW